MSTPEFRFPDLNLQVGKLNTPTAERLDPPSSIRDIERDARVIQLNSKLQLYRVGLASAALGMLFSLGIVGVWRWAAPSPASPSVNPRAVSTQRNVVPLNPAVRHIAPIPASSMPLTASSPVMSNALVASSPVGGVFAPPIRILPPASVPASEKRDAANDGEPIVRLPPPLASGAIVQQQHQDARKSEVIAKPAHDRADERTQEKVLKARVEPKEVIAKPARDHADEHKQEKVLKSHVEIKEAEAASKVANLKQADKKPSVTGSATHSTAPGQGAQQSAIIYVAPAVPPATTTARRPTAPASAANASVPSIQPRATTTMDIAGVPTEGVILVESLTPDGRLVRPYRVGQTLPSGEVLVSADPTDGRIVTNRRTINLKH